MNKLSCPKSYDALKEYLKRECEMSDACISNTMQLASEFPVGIMYCTHENDCAEAHHVWNCQVDVDLKEMKIIYSSDCGVIGTEENLTDEQLASYLKSDFGDVLMDFDDMMCHYLEREYPEEDIQELIDNIIG